MFIASALFAKDAKVHVMQKPTPKVPPRPIASGREHSRRKASNVVSLSANRDAATIGSFLSHQTKKLEGSHTEAIDLRQMLKTFCKGRGLPVPSTRRFGEAMRECGYAKDRKGGRGRVRYLGIELMTTHALVA
jgi:hypothetical protein